MKRGAFLVLCLFFRYCIEGTEHALRDKGLCNSTGGDGTLSLLTTKTRSSKITHPIIETRTPRLPLIQSRVDALRPKFKTKTKSKSGRNKGLDTDTGNTQDLPWKKNVNETGLVCGVSTFAPGSYRCPSNCPFLSPDPTVGCHWLCVSEEQCGSRVADWDLEECRECQQLGCERCIPGADVCAQCLHGYELLNGSCVSQYRADWLLLFAIVFIFVFLILVWYVHLLCLPTQNSQARHAFEPGVLGLTYDDSGFVQEVFDDGQACAAVIKRGDRIVKVDNEAFSKDVLIRAERSGLGYEVTFQVGPEVLRRALWARWNSCLRDPLRRHRWYPITTDLRKIPPQCKGPIGGVGLMLLFNYQFMTIIWNIFAIFGWLLISFWAGEDLLRVGTIYVEDPQYVCQAVHWGRAVRDRLRITKLSYTFVLYILSSIGVVWFAIRQRSRFVSADSDCASMMDYCVLLTGFPPETGADVEKDIERFLLQATGYQVVGVSVCWEISDANSDTIYRLLRNGLRRREADIERKMAIHPQKTMYGHRQQRWFEGSIAPSQRVSSRASICKWMCCACSPLFTAIDYLVGAPDKSNCLDDFEYSAYSEEKDKEDAISICNDTPSTGTAFAVFSMEDHRDAACAALQRSPPILKYKDKYVISAQKKDYEPETVVWENFMVSSSQVFQRMAFGVVLVLFAVLVWGVCFWGPANYYEAVTYAAIGQPPSFLNELSMSMLVLAGNLLMYQICSCIAEKVGFQSKDHAQTAYVILYSFAILVNAAFDLGIVVYTTYLEMSKRDVRTDTGERLADLPDAAAIFESYPMMKFFGHTLFQYNFPSSFLLPFMWEGLFTIALPYHLGIQIVRTRSVSRENAEECLAPIPMDLARYGDVFVNTILTTICFFTASGWVLWTLLGLLAGNTFVYLYDHFRVLRHVESFHFATGALDDIMQQLSVVPCGVLAAAIVYQVYGFQLRLLQVWNVWLLMLLVFCIHVVLHLTVLKVFVRQFKPVKDEGVQIPYCKAAQAFPGNWFTMNPLHCLRSKFVHGHRPPCMFYVKGKELCIQENRDIGVYYSGVHQSRIASAPNPGVEEKLDAVP